NLSPAENSNEEPSRFNSRPATHGKRKRTADPHLPRVHVAIRYRDGGGELQNADGPFSRGGEDRRRYAARNRFRRARSASARRSVSAYGGHDHVTYSV